MQRIPYERIPWQIDPKMKKSNFCVLDSRRLSPASRSPKMKKSNFCVLGSRRRRLSRLSRLSRRQPPPAPSASPSQLRIRHENR